MWKSEYWKFRKLREEALVSDAVPTMADPNSRRRPGSPGSIDGSNIAALGSLVLGTVMLNRLQHLKLFLSGSGDNQEDVDAVLSDTRVQKALVRHPLDAVRLFKAVRRVSQFRRLVGLEDEFVQVFGRYR